MRELPVDVVVAISLDAVVVPVPLDAATSKYIGAELVDNEPPVVELAAAKFSGGESGILTLQLGKLGMICVPPILKRFAGLMLDVSASAGPPIKRMAAMAAMMRSRICMVVEFKGLA